MAPAALEQPADDGPRHLAGARSAGSATSSPPEVVASHTSRRRSAGHVLGVSG